MSTITKNALATSLKKLMNSTPLDKITVKSIVSDCGVNRQTFYYHFQDVYDLLGFIYKTEVIANISDCKSYDTWESGFLKVFYYVKENKKLCMNTLNSLGRDHLETFLHNEVFKLLIDVVEEVAKGLDVSDLNKKFIANFYTFAFIGTLISWMKNDMKESPESIIHNIDTLIKGNIKKALMK